MTALVWDEVGSRRYEAGVDRGVLYPSDGPCVPWNGLTSVQEKTEGANVESYYLDGNKYIDIVGHESFAATIEAYTYPDEFLEYDGVLELGTGVLLTQQPRKTFSLSYRTGKGSDVDALGVGYKIHIVYNALAVPSTKRYNTLDDSVDASSFSWDISAKPISFPGAKPFSHVVIDTQNMSEWAVLGIENLIYGDDLNDGILPTIQELIDISVLISAFQVFDNGDGTWKGVAIDDTIRNIKNKTFEIEWDDIVLDDGSFMITTE